MMRIKENLKNNESFMKYYRRIRMEFSPYGFLRNFIAFPVQGFLREIGICDPEFKKVMGIRDEFNGKRCFIIATGPSLRIEDVLMLRNEYTFGLNTIFRLFEKVDWRPTFFHLSEPYLTTRVINEKGNNFDEYAEKYCFFNALSKKEIKCNKAIYLHVNWLDHVYNYGKSSLFKYHSNPVWGVYDYYSVTQECIFLAMFMGFKSIYLIGADNDYFGKSQHFSDNVENIRVDEKMA